MPVDNLSPPFARQSVVSNTNTKRAPLPVALNLSSPITATQIPATVISQLLTAQSSSAEPLYAKLKSIKSTCVNLKRLLNVKDPKQQPKHFLTTALYFDQIKTDLIKLGLFIAQMPKIELHGHTTGHLYPEDIVKYAFEKNLYVGQDSTFDIKPSPQKCLVKTLLANPNESRVFLDGLKKEMTVHQCTGDGLTKFFKACVPSDSATDPDYMPLSDQVIPVLKAAAADKLVYIELMGGFRTHKKPPTQFIKHYHQINPFLKALKFVEASRFLDETSKNNLQINHRLNQCWKKALRFLDIPRKALDNKPDNLSWLDTYCTHQAKRIAKCEAAVKATEDPLCAYSFIKEIARDSLKEEEFFLECAAGITLAKKNCKVVGITLVGDETSLHSTLQFDKQMQIFSFFHDMLQFDNITLHAGEFSQGVLSPDVANARVLNSITIGRAKRIGHGCFMSPTAIQAAHKLGVAVEICLGMNKKILKIEPKNHIFKVLFERGVDIIFNRDNGGINGQSLTEELVMAIVAAGFNYSQLKSIMRAASEKSFLPGRSIYKENVRPCELDQGFESLELSNPSLTEAKEMAINKSLKATMQMQLELNFVKFEQSISANLKSVTR